VPVHTTREKLLLEVMDEENLGKDRTLGHVELSCSDYIKKDEDGQWITNDQKTKPQARQLTTGPRSSPKGTLNFTASFYPVENVVDPEEEERESLKVADSTPGSPVSPTSKKSFDSLRKSIDSTNKLNGDRNSMTRSGTISSLSGSTKGDDLAKTLNATEGEQEENAGLRPKKELPKLRLTPQDLVKYGKRSIPGEIRVLGKLVCKNANNLRRCTSV
jgi:hypothetical protein